MTGGWQKFPLCLKQVNVMIQITTDHYQSYQLYPELVYEQIYNYLTKNNLLDSRQSGF